MMMMENDEIEINESTEEKSACKNQENAYNVVTRISDQVASIDDHDDDNHVNHINLDMNSQNDSEYESTSQEGYEEEDCDFDTDDEEIDDENIPLASEDLGGLVGLQNLGNTCYMNSALQALSNCQKLTRYVLDCPQHMRSKGLCRSYSELIEEIWVNNNSNYAVPTSIIRNIKCIYPAFRGCTQQDTQEFLRCFLEQLHDELKQPTEKNAHQTSKLSTDGDKKSNSSNNDDDQKSIITDTFEFMISSSVVCSNCNNISTTKETFKDLSIPIATRDHPYYQKSLDDRTLMNNKDRTLDSSDSQSCSSAATSDVSKSQANKQDYEDDNDKDTDIDFEDERRVQKSYLFSNPLTEWFWSWINYFSDWIWGPQVTLHDCLSIFFGTDPLEGDNEYSCEVCTKKNRGVKYLQILELPEVLCIHFKRYESIGSAKITTHVSFPLTGLDLAPFMSANSRPQSTTYNLIACICHHGSALVTGHYTTYALNCYDDQWYEFDDQYVTNVESYNVENSEAYILFYQRTTPDDRTNRQQVKASKLMRKSVRRRREGTTAG